MYPEGFYILNPHTRIIICTCVYTMYNIITTVFICLQHQQVMEKSRKQVVALDASIDKVRHNSCYRQGKPW